MEISKIDFNTLRRYGLKSKLAPRINEVVLAGELGISDCESYG